MMTMYILSTCVHTYAWLPSFFFAPVLRCTTWKDSAPKAGTGQSSFAESIGRSLATCRPRLIFRNYLRPTRLTVYLPILCDQNLISHRKLQRAMAPVARPGICLRPIVLVIRAVWIIHTFNFESICSHPWEEWLELTPACCHNTQTLQSDFHNRNITQAVSGITWLGTFLD
jgi:hypothetical protein